MDHKGRARLAKVLALLLHHGTERTEAEAALERARELVRGADLDALFAGLEAAVPVERHSGTRRGLHETGVPPPTSPKDAFAEMREAFGQMRDTAERLAAELAAAKRHIVALEETVDRLKAGAFPPAVRATPSSDAMRARNIVANAARTARAAAFAARHRPRIAELRGRGESLTEVARRLNAAGIPGPSGGLWSAQAVRRVERSG